MIDTIKAYLNIVHNSFNGTGWIIEAFIIILATLVLHTVVAIIMSRLHKRLLRTKNVWDDTFVIALKKPLGLLIWVVGISFAAQIIGAGAKDAEIFKAVPMLRSVGLLIIIVWFLIRFVHKVEENVLSPTPGKKAADKTTVHATSQILVAAIAITGLLSGLKTLGIDISALLAAGGIGGIAVAFAAKDLLSNFFGGMMIYLDKPFKVGDWINSPDRNIEGVVEHIGWRLTRIRTFDKRPMYVPNSAFSTMTVVNPSRMTNRRIHTNVGIRYDDATKVEVILKDVEEMLRHHEDIDTNQTMFVNLVEFGPSSLNFMIYTFTKTTHWVEFQGIQQDVFLKVIEIITKHGAQCAFPTTTVHVPEGLALTKSE